MKDFFLSIIIPVYEEGEALAESIRTIDGVLAPLEIRREFILVDDGSTDQSWQVIKELAQEVPGVCGLRFTRNFGKEAAIFAGLAVMNGDACVVMDADLQHPPALIPEMVRLWREEGYQVVEGVKRTRGQEGLKNKICATLFYRLLKSFSGIDLNNATDFMLLDKRVVSALLQMEERNTFFRGMANWVGYKRASIPFDVPARQVGKSKWSTWGLFKLAVNAITSFSSMPLQIVTMLGVLFLLGSFLLGIQTLYMKIKGVAVSGFTTVILLQLIVGSTLMISFGIIGTYIARIFDEVKARPRYLLAETFNVKDSAND